MLCILWYPRQIVKLWDIKVDFYPVYSIWISTFHLSSLSGLSLHLFTGVFHLVKPYNTICWRKTGFVADLVTNHRKIAESKCKLYPLLHCIFIGTGYFSGLYIRRRITIDNDWGTNTLKMVRTTFTRRLTKSGEHCSKLQWVEISIALLVLNHGKILGPSKWLNSHYWPNFLQHMMLLRPRCSF